MVILAVVFVITKSKSLRRLDQVHVMQLDLMHWTAMDNSSFAFKIWPWIASPIN